MRAFFEKYGEIAFIQMKKKPSGESRGFGFIRFVELQDQVTYFNLNFASMNYYQHLCNR